MAMILDTRRYVNVEFTTEGRRKPMTATTPRRSRPYRPKGQIGGRGPLQGGAKRRLTILGFLLPALTILALFVFWPMASALRLSFTDASGFGVENYIGFANSIEA